MPWQLGAKQFMHISHYGSELSRCLLIVSERAHARLCLTLARACMTKQQLLCTPRARTHTMTTPSAGRQEGRLFFHQGQECEAAAGLQGKKRNFQLMHYTKWVLGRVCRRLLSSRDAY